MFTHLLHRIRRFVRRGQGLLLVCSVTLTVMGCARSSMELDPDNRAALLYAQNGDLRSEVDALAKPLVDSGQTPGVIVGVLLPDGSQQFFSYGVADKETGATITPDTLFAIGSLSKGFLAAITAVLVQGGVLSWDATLAQMLPPEVALSNDAKKITLLQLATHTSGLPRQPMTLQTLAYFIQYLFTGESFYRHFSSQYALDYLSGFTAPNTIAPEYSNIGYGLLGLIVERQTGRRLDELLAEQITGPLGLRHTGYTLENLPDYAQRAHGYAGDHPKFIARGEPTPDWEFTDLMKGSAALHSTARDLLQFAGAHLHNDGSVRGRALADTLQVRFPRPQEGAAIAWVTDDIGSNRLTYQIGLVGGYTGYVGLDTSHGSAVVVLQNSFNWANSVGHRLLMRIAAAAEQSRARVTAAAP